MYEQANVKKEESESDLCYASSTLQLVTVSTIQPTIQKDDERLYSNTLPSTAAKREREYENASRLMPTSIDDTKEVYAVIPGPTPGQVEKKGREYGNLPHSKEITRMRGTYGKISSPGPGLKVKEKGGDYANVSSTMPHATKTKQRCYENVSTPTPTGLIKKAEEREYATISCSKSSSSVEGGDEQMYAVISDPSPKPAKKVRRQEYENIKSSGSSSVTTRK